MTVGQRNRILVVEDEPDVADLIKHALERDGSTEVEVASRGDVALTAIADRRPDAVILDLNLPVISGVCRILRSRPATANLPVIIVTARESEQDRIFGLDLGADDYITKPFSTRELTARVRAVMRRGGASDSTPSLVYRNDHLVVDFDAVSVKIDGEPIRLTRREFTLLRFLIENRNRVISRERLLDRVWGGNSPLETRSIDVHIGRLRSKLGPAKRQIETLIGMGYRFVD